MVTRMIANLADISKLGLTDLRGRVTIIPQDPTILSGTLRSTLDVFDEYDDVDIYAALKRVHLLKEDEGPAASASGQVGGGGEVEEERNENVFKDLSNPVSEGGDNFSTGEKQLIWSVLEFHLPCNCSCSSPFLSVAPGDLRRVSSRC